MAEVIWVELVTRHGHATARFRCTGPELHIGRSYRNDVVLDDPAVAPEHLRVTRGDDGSLLVEALGEAGSFSIGRDIRNRSVVDGDTVLRIGHTMLRIRDADYAVPPVDLSRGFSAYQPWLGPAILIMIVAGLHSLGTWLGEFGEPRLSRYLNAATEQGTLVLIWVALWAVFSRIFSGRAHFARHLEIALAGAIVYMLYNAATNAFAFSFAASAIASYAYVAQWPLLAILCFAHLQAISPARPVVKSALLTLFAAVAVAGQLAGQIDQRRFIAYQMTPRLLPPAFRIVRVENEGEFFARIGALREQLEADRKADNAAP